MYYTCITHVTVFMYYICYYFNNNKCNVCIIKHNIISNINNIDLSK